MPCPQGARGRIPVEVAFRCRARGSRHSRNGLKRRNRLNGDGIDESQFLAPLDEVLAKKATLAEDISRLSRRWNESVEPVFADYQY